MAKVDGMQQSNSSMLNRRRSSLLEHVDRIRGATSNQQLGPFWNNTPGKDSSKYISPWKDVVQHSNPRLLDIRRRSELEHINRMRRAYSNSQQGPFWKTTPSKDFLKYASSRKADDIQQPNSRLLNIRKSSELQHISRIRGASTYRQLDPHWENTPNEDYSKYFSSRKSDKIVLSKSRQKSTSDKNGITEKSPDYFNHTDFEHEESRGLPLILGEKKLTQLRPSKQSEPDALENNSKTEVDKHRKVTRRQTRGSLKTDESHENSSSEQSLEDLKRTEFKIRDSNGDSDEEYQESDAAEENITEQVHESRKVTRKKAHNSMDTGKSPENSASDLSFEDFDTNKLNDQDSKDLSDISGEENSMQTTKQVESNVEEENLKKECGKPRIVIRRRGYHDIENTGVKKKSLVRRIFPSRKNTKIRTQKGESQSTEQTKRNKNEQESNEKKGSKENENTFKKQSTESLDAEMYLTELGKLQIILDTKCISPQHAAVIVWLDRSVPDYRKSLSLSGSRQLEFLQRLKNESVTSIEAIPSPNPTVVFPSVTILKNLAVRSETEQKS